MNLMNLIENIAQQYNLALESHDEDGDVEYGVDGTQPVIEMAKSNGLGGEGVEEVLNLELKFGFINKGSMESQPVSLSRKGNEAYVVFGSDDTWEVKGDFTLPSVLFSHLNNGEVQARDYLLSVGSKSGDLYTVDLNKVKETGEKLIDYFI
ncbi:hypothetical protein HOE37_00520 [Candidatus Woesearchaeota archaeon]|jgi:hypothetical protein|nr:hypothetical protein [Candidatus Woesearchaeota archaeon]MBT4110319.1 hypothetical protein [Candidatus Woesearchaeota archaeon]MBT4336157.1 hypothetical protein [Candidatus Woesearchaeota archaeon]MBT4468864.1 hypothetical protein [Candidatus Woesearchaeota archaeon]MBT6744817.1 hypothetical protein [Candidatus Woesearchaeota archaeon]